MYPEKRPNLSVSTRQIGVAKSYIAEEPYISAKEPYVSAKEPQISAKEPNTDRRC